MKNNTEKTCLKLTVHAQWFILGYHGAKLNEYRELTKYWISRLVENNEFRDYDEVEFRNGHGDHRPVYRRKFIKTECGEGFRRKKTRSRVHPISTKKTLCHHPRRNHPRTKHSRRHKNRRGVLPRLPNTFNHS